MSKNLNEQLAEKLEKSSIKVEVELHGLPKLKTMLNIALEQAEQLEKTLNEISEIEMIVVPKVSEI